MIRFGRLCCRFVNNEFSILLVVEDYFKRLRPYWLLLSNKYCRGLERCDKAFRVGVSGNEHVFWCSLCATDGEQFHISSKQVVLYRDSDRRKSSESSKSVSCSTRLSVFISSTLILVRRRSRSYRAELTVLISLFIIDKIDRILYLPIFVVVFM